MEIFKLFGSILIDNDGANKSIDATDKKAGSVTATLGKGIATAGKWALGLTVAAGAGAAALFGVATKAAESTDRIDKLSQKIGLSRKGFQEWDFIMSQSGASVEVLQGGFKSFTKQIDEASKGTKLSTGYFKDLGVSINDNNGKMKSQEQLFNETVTALQGMEEGPKKAALANNILGKSASELAPLINGAAGSVEEMRKKANDLGLVLSDDAVDAGVKFTDSMDQVKRSLGALTTNIGASVMPMFQGMLEWISAHMPQIQSVFKVVFGAISDFVTSAADIFKTFFLPMLENVFKYVQSNWPAIQSIFDTVFSAIVEYANTVWKFFQDNIIPIFDELVRYIMDHWPEIKETFESVFNAIVDVVSKAWAFFKENLLPIIESFYGMIRDKMPQIESIISGVFTIIKNVVTIVWDLFENLLLPILRGLWEFIEPTFPIIGDIIKKAFDIVIGIAEGVVTVFEKITGAIRTAVEWLTSWNSTPVSSKNVAPTQISSKYDEAVNYAGNNAQGTDFWRGGLTWVGEEGPELINLSRGAQVFSNDESMAMAAGAGGGSGYGTANITLNIDGQTLIRILGEPLRDFIIAKTGLAI